MDNTYDVVVIGGGAAGLNAALVLARARRTVLVIDSGQPRNAPAAGIHGLLGREGMSPAEFLDRGREEVRSYGGQVTGGEVDGVDHGFTVSLTDGRVVNARRLLVTTGLTDELPDIPGLRDRWGRDVLHCPYCHGWEVRDQPIGLITTSPLTVHLGLLWRQWTDDLVLFRDGAPLPVDDAERLRRRGIRIVPEPVAGIEVTDDHLTGVRLGDGTVVPRAVVAAPPRMVARAGFLAPLGLHPVEHPSGMGQHIPADLTGRTGVPGVWVAGNVTNLAAQVGSAAAAGADAAAQINADLLSG